MTLSQMKYLSNWEKTHDTFNQNGQCNFNRVGHLVKMANAILVE